MDAFYASVEQYDNPGLYGKPVAVGGSRERGVVAAASYEARRFGVRSAMPSVKAKQLCPALIFVRPRFDRYKQISNQIREIFHDYTDLVEPLSLDEAFLDVTSNKKGIAYATDIAKALKSEIKQNTGLTASAGVSVNKFLAKIASDYDKPDGLFVIKPKDVDAFIATLKIEKFFGVGKVTATKMHKLGIHKGADLRNWSMEDLVRIFGKVGSYYYGIARGIDDRPVNPSRIRKSVGTERTYDYDLITLPEILLKLLKIEQELVLRLKHNNTRGRTLTLKVKFADFEQITRSKSIDTYYNEKSIHESSVELASGINYSNLGVRLLGLSISNLESENKETAVQLTLDF